MDFHDASSSLAWYLTNVLLQLLGEIDSGWLALFTNAHLAAGFTLGGGKSEPKGREKLGYSTDLRALEQLTVIDDVS